MPALADILRRRWFPLLIAQTALMQAAVLLLRPATSYRAIELHVPHAWLGAISASFAVLPVLLAVVLGRWVDRNGERIPLWLGACVVLAAAVAFWLIGYSIVVLIVASMALGVGHMMCMLGQQNLVARAIPVARRDSAIGHYSVAASIGQALGPGLIGLLGGSGTTPDTGRVFLGGVGLAVGALVLVAAVRVPPMQRSRRHGETGSLRGALRVPGLAPAILASVIVLVAIDLLVIYLPALGAERGVPAQTIAVLLTVRALSSLLSRVCMTWMLRMLGRRRLLIFGIIGSAAGIAVLPIDMPVIFAGIAMVIAGIGLGLGQPLTLAWVAAAAPPGVRATAISLRLTGNRLGQVTLPVGVGLVAAGAGTGGVLLVTAALLAGTAVTTAFAGGSADT